MLAGMLCTVEPALCLRVSKARLIGVSSTRCWRGGLIEGVTGGVTGGSCTGYGLPAVLRVHVQARVHGSSSYVSGAKQGYVGVVGAGALGSSTRMTTGRGGVTCLRTWLNKQCGLPIEIRPNNMNTKEFMQQDQVEQWITEWTQKNAKGTEQRVLRNFLRMDFAVQPNPKMQPCSSCEQPFMLFMLLPMKQHNMNTYDPDEHSLFCYNCCTEVGQMLHPGHRIHPDQQATERRKALNQNPPGMTETTPSSCTAGMPRPSNGSNYHSPRQAKTKHHSTLHMNGTSWFTWYGKPGKHIQNKDSRHTVPSHSRASKMRSSRLNRT